VTLDLAKLSPELRAMGDHLRETGESRRERLERARAFFLASADQTGQLAALARRAAGSWAAPLEPLDAVHPLPPVPVAYEILATDGSTIEPDRHGPAMCAVINVGRVRIQYGVAPSAELSGEPRLLFLQDDLYVRQGERQVLLSERLLDARRSVEEMRALSGLGQDDEGPPVPRVALADGLLTIWRQDWAAADAETVTEQFREALDAIAARRLPLAAYVSNPRSHWVVDLLRQHAGCGARDRCALRCQSEACALDGLIDLDLFVHLQPGDRSGLFQAVGRDAERYGEHNRSHFFYQHVGREIARVEVPGWVAEDAAALDLIQAVVFDQAERGQGYPVALARAHEQAVVGAGDRRAFRQLVVEALTRAGLSVSPSEKQQSKNMRAV
jgi:hypothetical protein